MEIRKWDLGILYNSFDSEEFQTDLKSTNNIIEKMNSFKSRFTDTSQEATLTEYLETIVESRSLLLKLASYCNLTLATDATNVDAMKYINVIQKKFTEMTEVYTLADKWISELDLESMKSDLIKEHAFYLNEVKDHSKYNLDEKTELLLSKLRADGSTAWGRLQGLLTSMLDVDIEINGEKKVLTLSEVRNLAYDQSSEIRKIAYEAELESYKKVENSISTALNAIKGEVNTLTELRGYDSPLHKSLVDSRLQKETLEAMINAIKEYLPHFRKYLKRKAKLLNHKTGLPFYDLFAPIGSSAKEFSIEDAEKYVFDNFNSFSPNMSKLAQRAFDEKWIDYTPRKGKRGGAFCSNMHYLKQSRVMTNFTGSFSDVLTLAHELGHAYHGDCIFAESMLNSRYTMPVAETASIMAETIVMRSALSDATKEEQIYLLESSLQDSTQVIVDILSRYIFEDSVFNGRKDTVLNPKQLNELMIKAQNESYGDGLDKDFLHPYMWLCKGHYYSGNLSFYNFPYAFGLLFAKGLYSQYLEKGESFVGQFDELLRLTGQKTVEQAAQFVDIDVTSIEFWRNSLEIIKTDIDKFIELTE
ncbi:M3 family oligoendopeptidase [Mycoplasmatota bacterium WC44]